MKPIISLVEPENASETARAAAHLATPAGDCAGGEKT